MNQARTPQGLPKNTHRMRRVLDRLRHLKAAHHARGQRRSWLERVIQRLRRQEPQDDPNQAE